MLCFQWHRIVVAMLATVLVGPVLEARDCNENGINDTLDIRPTLSFLTAVEIAPRLGWISSMISADMNGDDRPDLLLCGESVRVLLGQRDGTFEAVIDSNHPISPAFPHILVAEDLDSDGNLDVAVLSDEGVSTFLGNGDGSLYDRGTVAIGADPRVLMPVDLDGDGQAELITANLGPLDEVTLCRKESSVSVLRSDGTGRFESEERYPVGGLPVALVAQDFNRDGRLDLATAGLCERSISTLIQNGDGGFQPWPDVALGFVPHSMVSADFDGDTHPDLAVTGSGRESGCCSEGRILVLLGRGDGTFYSTMDQTVGMDLVSLITADFNGDGLLDLVSSSNSDDHLSVLLNRGQGLFEVGTEDLPALGSPIALDVNGDQSLDLAGATSGGVTVLLGTGDGTFPIRRSYAVWGDWGNFLGGRIVAADLDADDRPDILSVGYCSSGASVLFNHRDGTFLAASMYPIRAGLSFHNGIPQWWPSDFPLVVDLNGDGVPDLAMAGVRCDPAGCVATIALLFGRGDGTFEAGINLELAEEPQALVAIDLNGDGRLDLVTPRFAFLNRGDGTFLPSEPFYEPDLFAGSPFDASEVSVDLDGDHIADLFKVSFCGCCRCLCSRSHGALSLGKADGTFQNEVDYAVGYLPYAVVSADLDLDGRLDVVVRSASGIAVLLNRITPPRSFDANQNGIPDECETPPRPLFHRADPNSSGTTDISDAIATFSFLFLGDPPALACNESADSNNDGTIDISDGIHLLSWLFTGGPEPAAPGPASAPCGFDPDEPGSAQDLGCDSYTACN